MNDMFKLKSLIKEDTKIVAFVGTSKNGTSFISPINIFKSSNKLIDE